MKLVRWMGKIFQGNPANTYDSLQDIFGLGISAAFGRLFALASCAILALVRHCDGEERRYGV